LQAAAFGGMCKCGIVGEEGGDATDDVGVADRGIWAVHGSAIGRVLGRRQGGGRWEWALHRKMRLRAVVEFVGDVAVHWTVLLWVGRSCNEGGVLGEEVAVQQTTGGGCSGVTGSVVRGRHVINKRSKRGGGDEVEGERGET
jgi:hypothetical protein